MLVSMLLYILLPRANRVSFEVGVNGCGRCLYLHTSVMMHVSVYLG